MYKILNELKNIPPLELKIKKIIFKSFLEKINEKIKDVNLKIKEFEQKKIKEILFTINFLINYISNV